MAETKIPAITISENQGKLIFGIVIVLLAIALMNSITKLIHGYDPD